MNADKTITAAMAAYCGLILLSCIDAVWMHLQTSDAEVLIFTLFLAALRRVKRYQCRAL